MIKENLKTFFWWMNERHRIFLKRLAGKPWPWTKDEILQTYKFTNVFRELDRVTQELHARIDTLDLPPEEKLQHVLAFRLFNWPETYDAIVLRDAVGKRTKMLRILLGREAAGEKVFTGAYIVTNSGQSASKIELSVNALDVAWRARRRMWEAMRADGTMRGCVEILSEYPMWGSFTAYEVICDMRWQKDLLLHDAPDRLTWANPGPGARRGINRIITGEARRRAFSNPDDYVEVMRELWRLGVEKGRLGKHVLTAEHPVELREIEHSLCEYSKYANALDGKRLKNRYNRRRKKNADSDTDDGES